MWWKHRTVDVRDLYDFMLGGMGVCCIGTGIACDRLTARAAF